MKSKIFYPLFLISMVLFFSCKETSENAVPDDVFWNPEIVDEKAELKTNVEKILKELEKVLSSKSILELFGAGKKIFQVELSIDKNGKFSAFKVSGTEGSLTKAEATFLYSNSGFKEIFKRVEYKPAKYQGKVVGCQLYLHLIVTVDSKGSVIVPWQVKEFNITKRPSFSKEDDGTFTFVEQMPDYVGGVNVLLKFISNNVRYPEKAKRNGVEGKVMVQFTVNEQGKVIEPKILKGIGFGCDEEALRVVNMLKDWKPGKQSGKPVKVKMVIPFSFKLD